jgi:hypothetical protein
MVICWARNEVTCIFKPWVVLSIIILEVLLDFFDCEAEVDIFCNALDVVRQSVFLKFSLQAEFQAKTKKLMSQCWWGHQAKEVVTCLGYWVFEDKA